MMLSQEPILLCTQSFCMVRTNVHVLAALQVGTIINLVDCLFCGVVGILTTAQSRQAALDKAMNALRFIKRMVSRRTLPEKLSVQLIFSTNTTNTK